jgi:hypothetical protein
MPFLLEIPFLLLEIQFPLLEIPFLLLFLLEIPLVLEIPFLLEPAHVRSCIQGEQLIVDQGLPRKFKHTLQRVYSPWFRGVAAQLAYLHDSA